MPFSRATSLPPHPQVLGPEIRQHLREWEAVAPAELTLPQLVDAVTMWYTVVHGHTPRSLRLDDDLWSRVEQHASAMGLSVTHITRACLQHWARLADENPDAAALVVTRPNASLQELADLVVKLRPGTD